MASMSGSNPFQLPQTHIVTEQKDRSKLNDEYSALLQAIPTEQVSAAIGGESGRIISRAETCQLALIHIKNLEAVQQDLTQRGLVLKGPA